MRAYKRDYEYSGEDEIKAQINENGKFSIVVNGKDSTPQDFGRIASQRAKQVILQKVSEAEDDEYPSRYWYTKIYSESSPYKVDKL